MVIKGLFFFPESQDKNQKKKNCPRRNQGEGLKTTAGMIQMPVIKRARPEKSTSAFSAR
jgi:hypothetical protein